MTALAPALLSACGGRVRFVTDYLRELSDRLQPYVQPSPEAARRAADRAAAEVVANELLRRRDFAFVLHPESTLRPFLEQFSDCPHG